MNVRLGFIGCGKMASAIIKGVEGTPGFSVKGSEVNPELANQAQQRLNITVLSDNKSLVIDSDVIFLSVKPNQVAPILEEIKNEITEDKLILSIAAGVNTHKIENIIGRKRVVRIMPNTPALIKEGMFGVCKGSYATEKDVEFVISILSKIGKCTEVTEEQMDIVTAISGSGPAFFYKVIEDMARAGEKLGLDYDTCLKLSAQTAYGSAKMIMESGISPEQLIINVTTPGGCPAVGNDVLKQHDVAGILNETIEQTAKKASELGNSKK